MGGSKILHTRNLAVWLPKSIDAIYFPSFEGLELPWILNSPTCRNKNEDIYQSSPLFSRSFNS